ncbi:MAG: hypothetical protein M3R38_09025 [Actinomycetota bacterium]|nr:hypothetical protein [Actinomycetota bacterium]
MGASARLTVAALVGVALSYLYLVVVLIGGFVPMAITVPIALLLAGIVAAGWRPAPAIAAFVCVLGLLPEVPNIPGHLQESVTELPSFVVNVLFILPLFAVAIMAGVAATVRNYRRVS